MNIALIAKNRKKELMLQFCLAYRTVLANHHICATGRTARVVSEATGLKILKYLTGDQGGVEEIGTAVSVGEVDLLIFFRDPNDVHHDNTAETELLRLCDFHNIPYATNIASAEALLLALERGDLDWRANPPSLNSMLP